MNIANIAADTPVDCSDGRLGKIVRFGGSAVAPTLIVQLEQAGAAQELVELPTTYVKDTHKRQVLLRGSCAEILRVARPLAVPAPLESDALRITLIEERLIPSTEWREAGALEITRHVRTEVQELDVPVRYEEAVVERIAINRVLADDETLAPQQDGDTLIVPVIHEELVITKRRVLVEELRITRQIKTRSQHIAEEVRREEVEFTHPGLDSHAAEN